MKINIHENIRYIKNTAEAGCKLIRHGANHDIWYSPITQKKFPVPRHFAKEVPTGTLKDIVRKSGVEF